VNVVTAVFAKELLACTDGIPATNSIPFFKIFSFVMVLKFYISFLY
jgi:hypothetical protein